LPFDEGGRPPGITAIKVVLFLGINSVFSHVTDQGPPGVCFYKSLIVLGNDEGCYRQAGDIYFLNFSYFSSQIRSIEA